MSKYYKDIAATAFDEASSEPTAILILQTRQEQEEFKKLLFRGVNTWPSAPTWIKSLYDSLQNNPKTHDDLR